MPRFKWRIVVTGHLEFEVSDCASTLSSGLASFSALVFHTLLISFLRAPRFVVVCVVVAVPGVIWKCSFD